MIILINTLVQFLTVFCAISLRTSVSKCVGARRLVGGSGRKLVIRAELKRYCCSFSAFLGTVSRKRERHCTIYRQEWFVSPPSLFISPAPWIFIELFDKSNLHYLVDVIRWVAYLVDKPEIYSSQRWVKFCFLLPSHMCNFKFSNLFICKIYIPKNFRALGVFCFLVTWFPINMEVSSHLYILIFILIPMSYRYLTGCKIQGWPRCGDWRKARFLLPGSKPRNLSS